MNTYVKYCPNVFLAKCTEAHTKGEIIPVTTKYGKDNESIIYNLIAQKDGFYYYSIVRADGYNAQERARAKAEKFERAALNSDNKSDQYYQRSNKDSDFLSLGEPIKVGHHSERRHRRIIEQAQNNATKSVEMMHKAKEQRDKAEAWKHHVNDINLSMPESVEYFEAKLIEAKERHEGLKNGTIERGHSYSLTYAKKEVNELETKVALAKRLWS